MSTSRFQQPAIGAFRVIIGFLFVCRGASSLWSFPAEPASGYVAEFAVWPSWWAAVIQLVGGALVMLGVGTRIAALVCSGSMAYAYFVVHQPAGLLPMQNGGEPSAMFAWAFLLIAAVGSGSFALGSLRPGRRARHAVDTPASSRATVAARA